MTVRKFSALSALAAIMLSGSASGAWAETLKIGIIGPMTGGGAPWGIAMTQAANIASKQVNAKGGLDVGGTKYKVEVVAYDDQYKAAEAVAAYNRLVNQDDVKYILLLTSASTLAVKDSVESDEVLALTASFTSKAIDGNTQYMMRLSSIPQNYAKPVISWVAEHIKQRRVAVLNPNDETGWETGKVDEEAFKASGFNVVGAELFDRTQKEFQPLLTKVISLNPELIDLGSTAPSTAGLIIRQARDLGYKGLFLKTGGPGPKEILEAAGSKDAVEGMIAVDFADPETQGYQFLANEYRSAVGQDPNQMIAPYYDSVRVLLGAIQKAGDVDDTAKVLKSVNQILPMESILGGSLNPGNRQILSPIFVTEMKDGKAKVIGKVEVSR